MCCTTKTQTNEIEKLKKYFDEVLFEKLEKYQLLTLRDKSPKENYDWIVYLQVKIPYKEHNTHNGTSDEQYVQGVVEKVLDFIESLKPTKKLATLSLFGEEEEPLPKEPIGNDSSWEKYFKEKKRVLKNRLIKKYNFFELCDFTSSWFVYREQYVIDSWIKQLPQTTEDFLEIVKNEILKSESNDREIKDSSQWKDEYNYLCRDGALSDYEIKQRLHLLIRLDMVPYTEYSHINMDSSFSHWEVKKQTNYRFWYANGQIHGSSWLKADMAPKYDIGNKEFLIWVRKHFKIAEKEVISDSDILKENIKEVFKRVFKYKNPTFDVFKEINKAKSFKEFRQKAIKNASLGNAGGTGYSIDGFYASYNLYSNGKNSVITIEQSIRERIELGRSIDGLEEDEDGFVEVFNLSFNQILEESYRLFKTEVNLFSFAA